MCRRVLDLMLSAEESERVYKERIGKAFKHIVLDVFMMARKALSCHFSGKVWKFIDSFALPPPLLISTLNQSERWFWGWEMRCETGSHNVETGHSDVYSTISLFFKEQKNPIVYHVLVGLLSYRLLEFELQSCGVNQAVVSQGSS